MTLRLIILTVVLLSRFGCPGAIASEPSTPTDKSVVNMKPFKVVSQGWNVYWSLSFPIWGKVSSVSFGEVDAGSLAGKAGIKEGDQVMSINETPVKGMREQEMERLMWPAKATTLVLVLQAKDSKDTRTIELKHPGPPKPPDKPQK